MTRAAILSVRRWSEEITSAGDGNSYRIWWWESLSYSSQCVRVLCHSYLFSIRGIAESVCK